MRKTCCLPVFNILNFSDYNNCMKLESNFYVRKFKDHLKDNSFLEKPHGHDFYLILIITKGSGKHIIDSKEYLIEPGVMFIIAPGQVHQWKLSEDTDGYVLFFTKKYFLIDFNKYKMTDLPFFKSSFSSPYVKLNNMEQQNIMSYYSKLCREYRNTQFKYAEMIRALLNAMFIELHRIYTKKSIQSISYNYELLILNKFEALIDENFDCNKPLSFYTNQLNLSAKQLSYLCKKVINKTPSEMILERKILEAQRLLIHSDMSVTSISATLNYTDNSYFSKIFKKTCSLTPEQYRLSFVS